MASIIPCGGYGSFADNLFLIDILVYSKHSKINLFAQNKEKSYRELLLIRGNWNMKIFCLLWCYGEKKCDAERFGDPFHIISAPAPKKGLSSANVQSRTVLMISCVYISLYTYIHICMSFYNMFQAGLIRVEEN